MYSGISIQTGRKAGSFKVYGRTLMFVCALLAGFGAFAQPANDNPCNAIAITPTTTCNYQQFTTTGATATTGVPVPGCANYSGGDVWFSVVVPAGGSLIFDSQAGDITDGGMAIYSGTCTNLTLIECDDDDSPNGLMPKIVRGGLTPGSTVWIRFWEYGNNLLGTFGLCVTLPPPPPMNISPCTATEIVPGATCNYTTYTTTGAPGFPGAPAPGCAGYQGGDVWFKVTVPCGGSLSFDTQVGDITDGGMAIYSGTCDNLTLIQCDDDGSGNGLMPMITRSNLVAGSTIWVRFWEYGNNESGTFGLCASIPPPPGPGGNCLNAQPFCTSNVYTFPNSTNQPSLGSNGIYGCLSTTPNPVWYYMQVQTSGNITIGISQVSTGGIPIDVDFALWGPFTSLAASCGNLAASNIVSCSYSGNASETAVIPNAIAGQFYVLLLTNYSNQPGTITFQQTGGIGQTSCNIICTLSAANSGPVCAGGTFNLTSTNVANASYVWTGPNCFGSTQQNPTGITAPTVPGTYTYTVTATTPSGTQCTATTTLTVAAAPSLGADSTVRSCAGTNVNLTSLYNTTGFTSTWTLNGAPVANPAAVNISGIYQLVAANTTSCKDTALVRVIIDTVSFSTTTVNATCTQNGSVSVITPAGIAPYTYNLSTTTGVYVPSAVFTAPAGDYVISTRDSLGCTVSQPVTIAFTNDLTVKAADDVRICTGQSAVLTSTGTAGATYVWSPANGLDNPNVLSPTASPSQTTNYTLTATLGSCTQTDDVLVTVAPGVTVNAGPDLAIVTGETAFIQASVSGPVTSILWTPTTNLSTPVSLNTVAGPFTTGGSYTYTVAVQNALGCTASDDVVITVIPYCVQVRNAFTPNGDGNNDLWKVYDDYGCLRNVTVHVFNRYGNKVYESRDYRNNWDGRYSGKPLPDATYYAVLEFTLISGRVVMIKSDVTILR